MTTEWEDIQVKMGNWKPREYVPTSEDIAQSNLQQVEENEEYKGRTKEALEMMKLDKPELEEDDDFLAQYRQKRLEELIKEKERPRFGTQLEIQRLEFEVQVTRAPPSAVVIITLYQNYIPESVKLVEILEKVAKKH